MTRLVIGIDAGLTGALAVVEGGVYRSVHDLPTMAAGAKLGSIRSQVNAAGLAYLLRNLTDGNRDEALVVLEGLAGYVDHKAAIFSMGNSFGCVRGVVATLGLPLQIVRPQDWKRHHGLSRDKEQARRRAIELCPEAPLARKKDHNRAEAILIALYGWEALR